MTENRDPRLQALFADVKNGLEEELFVTDVMVKTRFIRYRLPAMLAAASLIVLIFALVLAPSLQGFALVIAWGMTTPLIELGEGWLAWTLLPINTVGSLLILVAKLIRMGQKKLSANL